MNSSICISRGVKRKNRVNILVYSRELQAINAARSWELRKQHSTLNLPLSSYIKEECRRTNSAGLLKIGG